MWTRTHVKPCLHQVLLGDSSSEQWSVADLMSRLKDELASNLVELDESQDIQVMQLYLQKEDPDCVNDAPAVRSPLQLK